MPLPPHGDYEPEASMPPTLEPETTVAPTLEPQTTMAPVAPTSEPETTMAPLPDPSLTFKQCRACLMMCAPCKRCTEGPNGTYAYGSCGKCWSCWNFGKDELKDDEKHMDKDCDAMHHDHDWDEHKVRCLTDEPKSKKVTSDCRPCWSAFGNMMIV